VALLASAIYIIAIVFNSIFYLNRKVMTANQSNQQDIDEGLKESGNIGNN
jgi:hypothetical protein